jgi:hypothetical protein
VGDPVRNAVSDLSASLARARELTGQRDTLTAAVITGSPGGAVSSPPWNPAAADVVTTVHEGARRLEASLRAQVTGKPGRRRGGSDENTILALEAVSNLSAAIGAHTPGTPGRCECDTCRVTRILGRWTTAAQLLPAIDEGIHWSVIPGRPRCPYCHTFALRAARAYGVVACHNPDCEDSDGNQPAGRLDISALNGDVILAWNDGLVWGEQ